MNQKQLGAEEQPRLLNILLEASTYAVVWRFLGDLHVVDMGLGHAGAGDAHEFRLRAHLFLSLIHI